MRDRGQRGIGSKHFESRDNVGPWRSDADEFSSYHTDFDLQVALELDESQGLYDDQEYNYAQHDMYARVEYDRRAYNYQTPGTPSRSAQRSAAAQAHAQPTPRTAAPARTTFAAARATTPQRLATNAAPRRAPNAAPLSAARSAPSGIRNAVSSNRSAAQPRYAAGQPTLQPSAALPRYAVGQQTLQPSATQPARQPRFAAGQPTLQPSAALPVRQPRAPRLTLQPRAATPRQMFVDDEPLKYPSARKSRWLGKLAIVLLLVGAGFAAHSYLGMQAAQKSAPVMPPPAAAVSAPVTEAVPAATPEATPASVPEAPTPPLTAQERRAAARAARAAMYAERRREREEAREARLEARRARAEARASEAEAPRHSKAEPDEAPAPSTSKSWKTDDADTDIARAAVKPSHANADTDLLAPENESDNTTDEPATPKRPAMADTGLLRINSRPWSVVYVDGHSVGHTPQMNLMLPTGEHEITLVNDEMQLRKTLTVDITPGTTTTRTLNLAE